MILLSAGNPAYRNRIRERFGFIKTVHSDSPVIWIHAVSVGEVLASRPLVSEITTRYPQYRILITTMTPTGAETVKNQFGSSVFHTYIPYDLPGAVNRYIRNIKPVLLIVMETEIWPNLFHHCRKNNIPVIIANARMSEKSCHGYKRLNGLTKSTLSDVSCVIAQGQTDARRFIELGMDESKVKISGSIKFDIESPDMIREQGSLLHNELFMNRPVWIAASTHAGEEEIVLPAYREILKQHPDCLLIIAPRHPERARAISELSMKSGFATARKSVGDSVNWQTKVYILDTLGELQIYYAASDLAFVGGSLVPHGGHNMLEPASLGIPVVTGLYNHNFSDIAQMLQEVGAAWVVADAGQLANKVNQLFADDEFRHNAGKKGMQFVKNNSGSIHRVMDILHPYLAINATS